MSRRTIPTIALAAALLLPLAGAADTDLDAFLARMEGGWYGENNRSPMGPTDFAMVWVEQ